MKHTLQLLILASAAVSSISFAESLPQTTTVEKVLDAKGSTTAEAQIKRDATIVVSPRTGVRYNLGDTENRPIIFQTHAIAPANAANINRIVATNPALSAQSQEKAKIALIGAAAVPTALVQSAIATTVNTPETVQAAAVPTTVVTPTTAAVTAPTTQIASVQSSTAEVPTATVHAPAAASQTAPTQTVPSNP